MNAVGMANQHFLEHGAIKTLGVGAKIGEGKLRLQIEQGSQIAASGFQIDQGSFFFVLGKHGGNIRGEGAGAGAAARRKNRDQNALRLGFRFDAQAPPCQFRIRFPVRLGSGNNNAPFRDARRMTLVSRHARPPARAPGRQDACGATSPARSRYPPKEAAWQDPRFLQPAFLKAGIGQSHGLVAVHAGMHRSCAIVRRTDRKGFD